MLIPGTNGVLFSWPALLFGKLTHPYDTYNNIIKNASIHIEETLAGVPGFSVID
jgi:hypothetical protein